VHRSSRPRWRSAATALPVVLAVVLVTAGCTDDAGTAAPADDDAGVDEPIDDGEGDQPTAEGEAQVEVDSFTFEPGRLTVAAQATVTWTNLDGTAHTVTAGEPEEPTGLFDEPLEAAGGTAGFTFDEEGTYPYHCSVHPSMTGEVVVEAPDL
jgi:plastocyanin